MWAENRRRASWKRHNCDPIKARSVTYDRVVPSQAPTLIADVVFGRWVVPSSALTPFPCLFDDSQEGSPWDNFREPTGVTRPNVDPLPHHYKFKQNWQVIKPHLADHERVFSKPTKPKWRSQMSGIFPGNPSEWHSAPPLHVGKYVCCRTVPGPYVCGL